MQWYYDVCVVDSFMVCVEREKGRERDGYVYQALAN